MLGFMNSCRLQVQRVAPAEMKCATATRASSSQLFFFFFVLKQRKNVDPIEQTGHEGTRPLLSGFEDNFKYQPFDERETPVFTLFFPLNKSSFFKVITWERN